MKFRTLLTLPLLLFLAGCCTHSIPQGEELAQWLQENFRVTDIVLSNDLSGTRYWAGVVRIGDDFYLMSSQIDSESMRWAKYLGKDLTIVKLTAFDDNASASYWNNNNTNLLWSKSVPFSDASNHRSALETVETYEPISKTGYGNSDFAKRHYALIANFIPTIKKLVADDDAATIAGMIRYPILLCRSGEGSDLVAIIEDADDLRRNYHLAFPLKYKQRIQALKDDDIFDYGSQGIRIGNGLFWLSPNGAEGIVISAF